MEVLGMLYTVIFGNPVVSGGVAQKINQLSAPSPAACSATNAIVDPPCIDGLDIGPQPSFGGSIAVIFTGRVAKCGTGVCVKVLRPGIEKRVQSDGQALATCALMASTVNPSAAHALGTLTESITAELDLLRELDMGKRVATALRGLHQAHAPVFLESCCCASALVYNYVDGESLDQNKDVPVAVSYTILEIMLHLQLVHGLCQADMNPGNFIYDRRTQKLTMIDFGSVCCIPATVVDVLCRVHLCRGDETRLAEVLQDTNGALTQVFSTQQQLLWSPTPFTVDFSRAALGLDTSILVAEIPPDFGNVCRAGIQMLSTLGYLGHELVCVDVMQRFARIQ